jgi:hypothetical protein
MVKGTSLALHRWAPTLVTPRFSIAGILWPEEGPKLHKTMSSVDDGENEEERTSEIKLAILERI